MSLKSKLKNAGIVVASAGALYLVGGLLGDRSSKNYLSEKDFENMQWCEVENRDGVLWDNYMRTDIPKNQINWSSYVGEVRRVNDRKENFTGILSVPCEKETQRVAE